MSLIRRCDFTDCEEEAAFMVGAWSEDGERLNETGDVCGSNHARQWIKEWLKDMADVEEGAA